MYLHLTHIIPQYTITHVTLSKVPICQTITGAPACDYMLEASGLPVQNLPLEA